jgi:tRNA modification GTPase
LWLEEKGSAEPIPCEIDKSKLIRVLTKMDLDKPQSKERYNFQISARTGEGMPDLLSALEAHFAKVRSTSEAGGISNSRQKFEVIRAVEAVSRALCVDLGYELIAEEIRAALSALGRLVGSVSPDDVLDEVFSRFCMGK